MQRGNLCITQNFEFVNDRRWPIWGNDATALTLPGSLHSKVETGHCLNVLTMPSSLRSLPLHWLILPWKKPPTRFGIVQYFNTFKYLLGLAEMLHRTVKQHRLKLPCSDFLAYLTELKIFQCSNWTETSCLWISYICLQYVVMMPLSRSPSLLKGYHVSNAKS